MSPGGPIRGAAANAVVEGRRLRNDYVPGAREAFRMAAHTDRRASLGSAFARAARRYWIGVFPCVCREVGQWRARASTIPDHVLRRLALENLHEERRNLDGAAAFAAFVPTARRGSVVRAQVAFQAAYDYVDTLSEQHSHDPVRNGDRLHRALLAALDPKLEGVDYYAHHVRRDDAGYLQLIVEACREALSTLPSFASVLAAARDAAARIVSYQSLSLGRSPDGGATLESWAREHKPCGSDLCWWEIAASAGSSLGVFVLISIAAEQRVRCEDVAAIEAVYFPWVGSLHTLLDSLVDRREDAESGQRSLLDYYASPHEAATRLGVLAAESLRRVQALPSCRRHVLMLAGMASHYLSMPAAFRPDTLPAARAVLSTIGGLAAPTMLVMGVRRAAARRGCAPPLGISVQ
jgi:tetraprenyl-beta-curcumene synthase